MRKRFTLKEGCLEGVVSFEEDREDDFPVMVEEIILESSYGESRLTRESTGIDGDLFQVLERHLLKAFAASFQPFWDARAMREWNSKKPLKGSWRA